MSDRNTLLVLPSQETLNRLLRYEPETGLLFWRRRDEDMFHKGKACSAWNTRYADKEAFTFVSTRGYKKGTLRPTAALNMPNKLTLFAHRVIWKMVHGDEPQAIDHINGDTGDNRASNLRSVSNSQNQQNKRLQKSSRSGAIGVVWNAQRKSWMGIVVCHGRRHYVGLFADIESAALAVASKRSELGFHPNHGRSS